MSKDDLLSGNTSVASHIICHVGDPAYANGFMPEGKYLTAWGKGGLDDTELIYQKLSHYSKEHRITLAGNAYEERLIDEIGAFDKEQQIIQVSIPISA